MGATIPPYYTTHHQHRTVYLLEEEVVSQMVEHHGIGGVNSVGLGEKLHPFLYGVVVLAVELEDGQANEGSHTLLIQVQCPLEGQSVWIA